MADLLCNRPFCSDNLMTSSERKKSSFLGRSLGGLLFSRSLGGLFLGCLLLGGLLFSGLLLSRPLGGLLSRLLFGGLLTFWCGLLRGGAFGRLFLGRTLGGLLLFCHLDGSSGKDTLHSRANRPPGYPAEEGRLDQCDRGGRTGGFTVFPVCLVLLEL